MSGIDYEGFEEARAIARRRRKRIGLPVAVVAIMIIALIGIAAYDYKIMRDDALALSKGVVVNLQSRIETEVAAYLKPIPGIISLTRDLMAAKLPDGIPRDQAEQLGVGMLNNAPSLTALFVGNQAGEFLMVRRFQEGEIKGLETKIIRSTSTPGGLEIELTRRDASGKVLSSEIKPWDQYDPRKRPWYQGANDNHALYWTDVYPFFTDRAAGITGALPVYDQDDTLLAAIGADVTLESISGFLRSLSIGKTGQALIVDDQGRIIAHPSAKLIQENDDGKLRLTLIGDIDDPVARRAFDRYRVEGHGRRDFELNGRRYISSASSLNHLLNRDWSILVVVPEDDFVGFVVDNVSKTLAMGLGVIALAALLAAVMIRQGLRADRDATQVLEREAQLDAQGEAFGELARQSTLFESAAAPHAGSTLEPVTESVAQAARVRRSGIWQLSADAQTLLCSDSYDRDSEGHTRGARLSRDEHPELFKAMTEGQGELLHAVDASRDPRLASLFHNYLTPLGCRAFVSVPITVADRVTGALWLEDGSTRGDWPEHTLSFSQAIANLLAIRQAGNNPSSAPSAEQLENDPTQADDRTLHNASTPIANFAQHSLDTDLTARRAAAFTARLAQQADAGEQPCAEVIDRLAVMSLSFTDAMALAAPMGESATETTVAHLLNQLQTAAQEHQIGYLKFLSDRVVASVDPAEQTDQGLEHLIQFAMATKHICETSLAGHQAPLSFRIGVDLGPVIGTLMGEQNRSFTFWGEAVQMAGNMADTSLPGAIQVTESVYQELKDRYLFQLRGHHFLKDLGEFSTYLLSGRL